MHSKPTSVPPKRQSRSAQLQGVILAFAAAEPGAWTNGGLASDLSIDVHMIQTARDALKRKGLVVPRVNGVRLTDLGEAEATARGFTVVQDAA